MFYIDLAIVIAVRRCSTANVVILTPALFKHDARVVIHWRYAPCDKYYRRPFVDETGWGGWVDEYYSIYSDTVNVRKATLYPSEPDKFNEWHETISLVGAGTIPKDNIHLEAITLTNMQGNYQISSWEEGFPHSFADGLSVM